ncbi:MAG: carotenoid biosynthesis protein [Ilumatobacteraceae bacterium]
MTESRDPMALVAAAAGAITTAGMIATPLLPRGGPGRRLLSSAVVIGLAATTKANVTRRWGVGRAGVSAIAVGATTAAVERIGTRTGIPFGRYEYSGALRPEVAGVPAIVPLAWFAMAVPAREAAHAALGDRSSAPSRVLLGAAALTAWDLFLDPQMVGEGYWTWARRGVYRGIPATNFVGWFVTGVGVMSILERTLPVEPACTEGQASVPGTDARRCASGALVGQYGFMAVMETVGFARYFRDPLVAIVGGAAMLSVAAAAIAGKVRR